jgi:hypothetical protein
MLAALESLHGRMAKLRSRAMTKPLRVLLTNICLNGRSGTEIVTRNMAFALLRQGHLPTVFTFEEGGSLTRELRLASVPVITDLDNLRGPIDIIHGHHNPTTAIAAARFPEVPAVFVCHDFISWHDIPPRLANIKCYVAVDHAVQDRLTRQEGVDPALVRVILNAVDTERFAPGAPLPPRPVRAVLFAKDYASIMEVTAACNELGISLDVIGPAAASITASPERLMPGYDLVFASAMTALEALACGRAVTVCDGRGLAGMASPSNFDEWRPKNFGCRTLTRPLRKQLLIDEIGKYDARGAAELMRRVRKEADIRGQADAYIGCYREAMESHRRVKVDIRQSFQLLSEHLHTWSPRRDTAWPWMEERARLKEELRLAGLARKTLPLDQAVLLCAGAHPSDYFRMVGFHDPEDWGTWTDTAVASLGFQIATPFPRDPCVELMVTPFVQERHECLQVSVSANGRAVSSRTFDRSLQGQSLTWELQLSKLPLASPVWLHFEIESPASPYDLGLSGDKRRLGLGFISLTVKSGREDTYPGCP